MLSMAYAPEPDLFIRTGGEQRISNFLLWQLAYTELYFTDTLWPDFGERHLRQALADVGLEGAVKTSGAKGVHVFVPINRRATIEDAALLS